jgi:hypothetical protein
MKHMLDRFFAFEQTTEVPNDRAQVAFFHMQKDACPHSVLNLQPSVL